MNRINSKLREFVIKIASGALVACSFFPLSAAAQEDKDSATSAVNLDNVNTAVTAARAATKDKHYDQAEALMLKVTAGRPELVIPWVELGLAQLGLKKYPEAENSFKIALGIDPESEKRAHTDDFFQSVDAKGVTAPAATRASRNTNGGIVNTGQKRTPDLLGTGYASLGDIYIHQGKVAEAQGAFDTAVKDDPANAGLYRRNEMIFFFQTGHSAEQLKSAEQAITLDPGRAMLYYFKGQALVSQATLDPKTQKMILPPGCGEAYQKYLELDPNGPYSADAKGVLAAAGITVKEGKKK